MLVHTSMPPWQIYLASAQAGLLVLIYEDWLRRVALRDLAAKHAIDKNKVADGQQHAKAPPD
jgi:hypothetical protein